MTTRVVHVLDKIPGAVYIGRAMPRQRLKASAWANPRKISDTMDRLTVCYLYQYDLLGRSRGQLAFLPELRGKPLACWCRHDGEEWTRDTECHGDTLVALLNRYTDDELRSMAKGDAR